MRCQCTVHFLNEECLTHCCIRHIHILQGREIESFVRYLQKYMVEHDFQWYPLTLISKPFFKSYKTRLCKPHLSSSLLFKLCADILYLVWHVEFYSEFYANDRRGLQCNVQLFLNGSTEKKVSNLVPRDDPLLLYALQRFFQKNALRTVVYIALFVLHCRDDYTPRNVRQKTIFFIFLTCYRFRRNVKRESKDNLSLTRVKYIKRILQHLQDPLEVE